MFRAIFAFCVCLLVSASLASAQDRHEGYYYPPITSEEVFERAIRDLGNPTKQVRIDFIQTLTQAQLADPAPPQFMFFAKGEAAKDLIVIGLNDDVFETLYRARAVMAQMTVSVREGPFFVDQNLQFLATFYDLLQILEFDTLVISDGKSWSHKVTFDRS
ncbi:MAG: hypothetical protein HRU30_14035 [Rhodobacteraceae bacterium]|nr:hypothetical protein [Paracoccaceae bacterium]